MNTQQIETNEQHSIGKSIALHLLPGVFILVLFLAAVPLVMRAGYPPIFAMSIGGITLGLGFQVWHLYNEGKSVTASGHWKASSSTASPCPSGNPLR